MSTGPVADGFWEDHYRGLDPAWGRRPNAQLLRLLGRLSLRPGRVLDLGCGHGGDALELARRGWDVLAIDVSPTAIARLDAAARAEGLADLVRAVPMDLETQTPAGRFDLVLAAYLHGGHSLHRERLLHDAAARLVPGGVLIVLDHASVAPWSWNRDEHSPFPSPVETLTAIGLAAEDFAPIVLERSVRTAEGPDGVQAEVADNVIAVERNARSTDATAPRAAGDRA